MIFERLKRIFLGAFHNRVKPPIVKPRFDFEGGVCVIPVIDFKGRITRLDFISRLIADATVAREMKLHFNTAARQDNAIPSSIDRAPVDRVHQGDRPSSVDRLELGRSTGARSIVRPIFDVGVKPVCILQPLSDQVVPSSRAHSRFRKHPCIIL